MEKKEDVEKEEDPHKKMDKLVLEKNNEVFKVKKWFFTSTLKQRLMTFPMSTGQTSTTI